MKTTEESEIRSLCRNFDRSNVRRGGWVRQGHAKIIYFLFQLKMVVAEGRLLN